MTILARPLPPRTAAPPALAGRAVSGVATTNATLLGRLPVGATAALFTLRLDEPLTEYRPGQYVALGLPAPQGMVQRPYSIASVAGGRLLIELLIRRVDGGELSPSLWRLGPEARLRVGAPRGLFTLDDAPSGRRLFVGAGTGVAPLLAMLEACTDLRDGVPATLIHGAAHASEFVFDERMARWRLRGLDLQYRPTISRPTHPANAGWGGLIGRAETALVKLAAADTFDPRETVVYVCGNPQMVDNSRTVLVELGVPVERIRCERF